MGTMCHFLTTAIPEIVFYLWPFAAKATSKAQTCQIALYDMAPRAHLHKNRLPREKYHLPILIQCSVDSETFQQVRFFL